MIPFGDLSREYQEFSEELETAIKDVCQNGWFILGKKVEELENIFARYIGNNVYGVGVGLVRRHYACCRWLHELSTAIM